MNAGNSRKRKMVYITWIWSVFRTLDSGVMIFKGSVGAYREYTNGASGFNQYDFVHNRSLVSVNVIRACLALDKVGVPGVKRGFTR